MENQDRDKGCYVRHYGKRYKGDPCLLRDDDYFTYENFGPTVDFEDEDDLYFNEIVYNRDEIRVNQVLIEKIEKNREKYPKVTIIEVSKHEVNSDYEVIIIDGEIALEDTLLDKKIRENDEKMRKNYEEYLMRCEK